MTLKQGPSEKFTEFLAKFNREMAKAGIVGEDKILVQYLGNVINTPLRHIITPIPNHPNKYITYCTLLLKITSRIEHKKSLTYGKNNMYKPTPSSGPALSKESSSPAPPTQGDIMDWEPAAQINQLRAH